MMVKIISIKPNVIYNTLQPHNSNNDELSLRLGESEPLLHVRVIPSSLSSILHQSSCYSMSHLHFCPASVIWLLHVTPSSLSNIQHQSSGCSWLLLAAWSPGPASEAGARSTHWTRDQRQSSPGPGPGMLHLTHLY